MNASAGDLDIGLLVLGYSRADLFERAARSLAHLGLPDTTPRYGVIDGARASAGPGVEANRAVQLRGESLRREGVLTNLTIRPANLGTMRNVITSVTEVLSRHAFIFVLEDDLEILPVGRDALRPLVAHMGGVVKAFGIYCNASGTDRVFLSQRFSSQAWGTSRTAWEGFDAEAIRALDVDPTLARRLKAEVGSDMAKDVAAFQDGRLDTWAVPWNVFNLLRGGRMVYAPQSYVVNNSHLAGAERTWGIEFPYETATRPVSSVDVETPRLNTAYLRHFSTTARVKRRLRAEIMKRTAR